MNEFLGGTRSSLGWSRCSRARRGRQASVGKSRQAGEGRVGRPSVGSRREDQVPSRPVSQSWPGPPGEAPPGRNRGRHGCGPSPGLVARVRSDDNRVSTSHRLRCGEPLGFGTRRRFREDREDRSRRRRGCRRLVSSELGGERRSEQPSVGLAAGGGNPSGEPDFPALGAGVCSRMARLSDNGRRHTSSRDLGLLGEDFIGLTEEVQDRRDPWPSPRSGRLPGW